MYGYVVPDKSELSMRDFVLYRSFYCGLCKLTGKVYGQFPRFTTNYDMTFFAALLHDLCKQEVKFYEKACVLNPFKKKLTVDINPLMEKIGAANIILSYYKAEDGVRDREGGAKRLVRGMLKKPHALAAAACPDIEDTVRTRYEELTALEREGASGIDRTAHPFAEMLKGVGAACLGDKADENKLSLLYNLGKFVYLVDAADDIDEDAAKRRYNPLIAEFGYDKKVGRRGFFEKNSAALEFAFATVVNRIAESFNKIEFTECYDLLKNIVYLGMRRKVNRLLSSDKKLPPPRI